MTYTEYKNQFDEIINAEHPCTPYDNHVYFSYVILNRARMRRWEKQLKLDSQLVKKLNQISSLQHWIIIAEPWCGDAAHILPFLMRMVNQSELISYDIQLRDTHPFLIGSYLTNGKKSIPKLIVQNESREDLFTWGPRPESAQRMVEDLRNADKSEEDIKVNLQRWYNDDKGRLLCSEIEEFYQ